MEITNVPLDRLKRFPNNPRQNKKAVQPVADSIREFGFKQPIVVDKDFVIIVGHTRHQAAELLGLETAPTLIADDLSPEKVKAYRIADNRTGDFSEWDYDKLRVELEELKTAKYDLKLTGFDTRSLAIISKPKKGLVEETEIPELPESAKSVGGHVYKLGKHRVMCGDSSNEIQLRELMNGEFADLLHADPPYGMGKENVGVLNDNLKGGDLDRFQMKWITAIWQEFLYQVGSFYIWGNPAELWRLYYEGGLSDIGDLHFKNNIVWHKGSARGISSDDMRTYPPTTEHCLFFIRGTQEHGTNADNYWQGWDEVIAYLKLQKEKSGLSNKDLKTIIGHSPDSGCHWFDKSQWIVPNKDIYEAWVRHCSDNKLDGFTSYEEFENILGDAQEKYDAYKKSFYDSRAYFNNSHEKMTDVWQYPSVAGAERHGHATPKPVDMMIRIIKSSCEISGLVLEPFGGSGSTLIACEATDRKCYTMELDPKYVDVIRKRWAYHVHGAECDWEALTK